MPPRHALPAHSVHVRLQASILTAEGEPHVPHKGREVDAHREVNQKHPQQHLPGRDRRSNSSEAFAGNLGQVAILSTLVQLPASNRSADLVRLHNSSCAASTQGHGACFDLPLQLMHQAVLFCTHCVPAAGTHTCHVSLEACCPAVEQQPHRHACGGAVQATVADCERRSVQLVRHAGSLCLATACQLEETWWASVLLTEAFSEPSVVTCCATPHIKRHKRHSVLKPLPRPLRHHSF